MIRRGSVVLVGPTAAGKSMVALAAAERADADIVSLDSMSVYRGMDIGTAKPSAGDQRRVRHHLVDLVDPADEMTVAVFQAGARAVLDDLAARDRPALLVGGTGLYVRAVIDDLEIPGRYPEVRRSLEAEPDTAALHARLLELDPVAAGRMEPTNRRRVVRALEVSQGSGRRFSSYGPGLEAYPPLDVPLIGLAIDREALDARIEARFAAQIGAGWLDEARALAEAPRSRTARQALGYRELWDHLEGSTTLEEALDLAVRRTKRFARRQQRWFRRDPRIVWIPVDDGVEEAVDRVTAALVRP